MVSQEMRSTQLLFNHGPGSILETVNGPVVVQKWSSFLQQMPLQAHNFPQAFEIRELRLSDQLYAPNGQAHLHRIPSNAEVGLPADRYLLRTNRFPDSFAIVQQPMAAMRCSSTTGPSPGKTRRARRAGNRVPPFDSSPTVQTATSTMLIGGTTCVAQTIPINVQPHPTSGMNATRAWRALTLSATIAVPAKISPKLPEISEGVPVGILKSSLVSITNGPEIALRR